MFLRQQFRLWLVLTIGLILLTVGCVAVQPREDAERWLDEALSRMNDKNHFAFTGTAFTETSGIPGQKSLAFEGYVAEGNQLFVRPLESGNEADGAVASRNLTAEGGRAFIRTSTNEWKLKQDSDVQANPSSAALETSGSGVEWLHCCNPLMKLEQLQVLKKNVAFSNQRASNGHVLLEVTLDEQALRDQLIEQLRSQTQPPTDEQLREFARTHQLSAVDEAQMRQEIADSYEATRGILDETLQSLETRGTYNISIDRETRLPLDMRMDTFMRYLLDGEEKEEKATTSYEFKAYDSETAVP